MNCSSQPKPPFRIRVSVLVTEVNPEPSTFLVQENMKEKKDSVLKMKKERKVFACWTMKSHSGS